MALSLLVGPSDWSLAAESLPSVSARGLLSTRLTNRLQCLSSRMLKFENLGARPKEGASGLGAEPCGVLVFRVCPATFELPVVCPATHFLPVILVPLPAFGFKLERLSLRGASNLALKSPNSVA